jgi:hypothetical protein
MFSLLLAYVYPIAFFVLAYSFFEGSNEFAGIEVLPEQTRWRFLYFPGLLLYGLAIYGVYRFFLRNADSIDQWIPQKLERIFSLKPSLAQAVYRSVLALLGGAIGYWYSQSWAVALAFGLFAYWSGAVAVAVAVAVAGAVAGAVAVAVAGAVAVAVAVAGAVYQAFVGNYEASLLFAGFYLALPLINALMDWGSWWVSRYFLERASRETRVWNILRDLLYDSIWALLFMLLLCVCIPAVIMGLNGLYSLFSSASIDWTAYAVAARTDPWGKGIMVTLMLITTLIPTLLHIALGVVALLLNMLGGKGIAEFIKKAEARNNDALLAGAAARLTIYMLSGLALTLAMAFWAIPRLWSTVFKIPIARWLYQFTDLFYNLPPIP